MFSIKEEDLPPESQVVLEIIRKEFRDGLLTEGQRKLLEEALAFKTAWSAVSKFIIAFGAVLLALKSMSVYFPKFGG